MQIKSGLTMIENNYQRLTKTERVIADYVLAQPNSVIYFSVQELAAATDTSSAAVIRFSKSIGFKGFAELKLALANIHHEKSHEYDEIIKSSDSLRVMNHKLLLSMKNSLDNTFTLLDEQLLATVIDKILKAHTVYMIGQGISGLVAQDFKQRIERIGIRTCYDADPHVVASMLAYCQPRDVVCVVSYSGEHKMVNQMAAYAKQLGATLIAVTGATKNSLAKFADFNLIVPVKEPELRIAAINSRMACLAVLDAVYMGLVKNDIDGVNQKILQTKAAVSILD